MIIIKHLEINQISVSKKPIRCRYAENENICLCVHLHECRLLS